MPFSHCVIALEEQILCSLWICILCLLCHIIDTSGSDLKKNYFFVAPKLLEESQALLYRLNFLYESWRDASLPAKMQSKGILFSLHS